MSDNAGDQYAALPSGTTICFRDFGARHDPTLLLIAGLGEDLTVWTDTFVGSFVAQGFRVIIMDNRDVGQSTFVATPPPRMWRQVLGCPRSDGYSLADMADDCVGVLNHLGIAHVHLVGRSMGGMIAQTIAATEPQRVLSLTSIYSTTGSRKVGQPALSTIRLLMGPPARTRTAAVRAHLRITGHIAGSAYPIDDAEEAAVAARGWDRSGGDQAAGVARQIQAIQSWRPHRTGAPDRRSNAGHQRRSRPDGESQRRHRNRQRNPIGTARRHPRDGPSHSQGPGGPDYPVRLTARGPRQPRRKPCRNFLRTALPSHPSMS